ncbi:MAG TPA: IS1182 family transposase [Bacteroidales bacterium]|nr:IS1182 family transposase [Bacteroidales bacterium]
MPHKKGTDLEQLLLLPPILEDFIGADNPVRIIAAFADSLDVEKLMFVKAKSKEIGCRPYHPGDLLKLYMYGYLNRIRTSRKLERECTRNIELMWLLKDLRPSARTIAYFRSDNKRALKLVFRQFIALTKQWGLIEGNLLATDGSKLRAVNSKKNNYNAKKIAFHFDRIDEKIQQYLDELDKGDKEENGNRKEDVQKAIKELKERRRKYEELEKKLKETGEDQISTTDEESRQLMIRGQITEVSYNIQTTADSKHNLVIDVKAINTNDKKMAPVMGRRAKVIIGNGDFDHLLDKGYHDGEAIAKCEEHGIRTLISQPSASRSGEIPTPEFYNDKFRYDKETDSYTCPAGNILNSNGNMYKIKSWNGHSQMKQYKTSACRNCVFSNKCTSSPKERGRIIQRSIYQDSVDANNLRVKMELEKYRRRQEMIEHPFGIVKRQWGYDHVLLKGIDKVEAEASLIFLCYNLRRLIKILGFNALIEKIKAFSLFLQKIDLFRLKMRLLNFEGTKRQPQKWIRFPFLNRFKMHYSGKHFQMKLNYCADWRCV